MIISFYSPLLILIINLFSIGWSYVSNDVLQIELYHALNYLKPDEFSYRGNITVSSLSTGDVYTSQNIPSQDEKESLMTFGKQNDFYRLKSIVVYSDSDRDVFYSSSKAQSLISSQLSDVIWISMSGTNRINAITQSVISTDTENFLNKALDTSDLQFNTAVFIRHIELAPAPDTVSYIQKMDRDREAREKGEGKDNRGFFAKYWMYIVPVVLLVFISGATNQEAAR